MDPTVYRLRCGEDPFRSLHHPPLAGLYPEQLVVQQIQWSKRRIEQQGPSPEAGSFRPSQLRRLPQMDPFYLWKTPILQRSSARPGRRQERNAIMIPDRAFLRRCAHKNHLSLPQKLEDWLLVHFEDEPYEDFNTASVLRDMVCMYCQSYADNRLDVTTPDPVTRLREHYEYLNALITDLRVDISYLQELCDDYERILKKHSLL